MKIKSFTFNPFQENTFIAWDDTRKCIIIDPGCYQEDENKTLKKFIEEHKLEPVKLINTHCHIDHILGNDFVIKEWGVQLYINERELFLLENSEEIAKKYQLHKYQKNSSQNNFLSHGDIISFGNSKLKVLFTPGHSPGHISLLNKEENFIFSGDVLFKGSIGRTDLPGGDFDTLIHSIKTQLLTLRNETIVYCGHGPSTLIDTERLTNPFL